MSWWEKESLWIETINKKTTMKITTLAKRITFHETGKVQVSIAQAMEILKVINWVTGGAFYKMVRKLK